MQYTHTHTTAHTLWHTHIQANVAHAPVRLQFYFFFAGLGPVLLWILLLDSFLCARLNLVAGQQKCSHLEFIIAAAFAVASCTF